MNEYKSYGFIGNYEISIINKLFEHLKLIERSIKDAA